MVKTIHVVLVAFLGMYLTACDEEWREYND